MKKRFSTSWASSSQPRKQRKFRHNAPLHIRHKFLSAGLSKELRKRHGKRSIPIRKGDEVLIMRGTLAGKKAKVDSVSVMSSKVSLEGITRQKKDGSKVQIMFEPSNLQIQSVNMDDKRRATNAPNKS